MIIMYDEMADDILEQEKKKPTQFAIKEIDTDFDPTPDNLIDVPKYKEKEYMNEEEFSDTYRTPNSSYETNKPRFEDLPEIGVLAPEITVTDDIFGYTDKEDKKYPARERRVNKIRKTLPYEQESIKNKKYEANSESAFIGLYDPNIDEIVIDKKFLKESKPQTIGDALVHENIHKHQRNIEYAKTQPRVLTEPGIDMFTNMWKENVIRKDIGNATKGMRLSTAKRKRAAEIKHRQLYMKEFENYPFAEQLAYAGEELSGKALTNPKTKTERVLKRMWFKEAPFWGMEV